MHKQEQDESSVTLLDYDEEAFCDPSVHAFVQVTAASLVHQLLESQHYMYVVIAVTLNMVAMTYYDEDDSIDHADRLSKAVFQDSMVLSHCVSLSLSFLDTWHLIEFPNPHFYTTQLPAVCTTQSLTATLPSHPQFSLPSHSLLKILLCLARSATSVTGFEFDGTSSGSCWWLLQLLLAAADREMEVEVWRTE